jgi:hypothetical protein
MGPLAPRAGMLPRHAWPPRPSSVVPRSSASSPPSLRARPTTSSR